MARFFHRRPRGEPEVEPPQLETPPVVSPVVSRVSSVSPFPVATPGAVSENDGDYFQPLSEIPSAQSHLSVRRTEDARPPQRLSERPYLEGRLRAPSIRLRRLSNGSLNSSNRNSLVSNDGGFFEGFDSGRQRSISQPERARVNDGPPIAMHSARVPQIALPRLTEEGGRPSLAELGVSPTSPYGSPLPTSPLSPTLSLPDQRPSPHEQQAQRSRMQRARNISKALWPPYHRHAKQQQQSQGQEQLDPTDPNNKLEYANELVDWLDTIDPEVQTLSTLTNVQNSLFIPDLGHWLNRRPTYVLSENDPQSRWAKGALQEEKRQEQLAREPTIREPTIREPSVLELPTTPGIQRSNTITSRLTDSHYAALPHGTNLEGWTAEEKEELDDHVRHMLHSRRARWKRQLKGFGQYVRRPLGFFVTLYATLITLFGLAWVLFLIGWIYVGDKQYYVIHIIDSVLVALFAIMGDGLAPFRAVDTYHMIYIARYSRIINNKKKGKKPRARLQKKNIPPDVREELERAAWEEEQRRLFPGLSQDQGTGNRGSQEPLTDLENAKTEFDPSWLTPKQQKSLEHHQAKLAKSHSFYKPYETFTHNAFPLSYLIAIVVLLDCHSCLQISLGACTWGIDYHVRPFALTTVILCVSITCNITAGLVITIGDRKTRKKDVMKLLDRQELTGDAIKHMEEKKKKEQEKEDSSNPESPREGVLGGVLSKETSLDSGKEKGRTKLTKDPSSSSSS